MKDSELSEEARQSLAKLAEAVTAKFKLSEEARQSLAKLAEAVTTKFAYVPADERRERDFVSVPPVPARAVRRGRGKNRKPFSKLKTKTQERYARIYRIVVNTRKGHLDAHAMNEDDPPQPSIGDLLSAVREVERVTERTLYTVIAYGDNGEMKPKRGKGFKG